MEELIAYYQSFSKQELAEAMATVSLTGILEPLPPPEVLDLFTSRRPRGRPTVTDEVEDLRRLHTYLQGIYPLDVPRAKISRTVRMSPDKALRLAELLPEHLRTYFFALPVQGRRVRLSPVWRAVLDLHNYSLVLTYGTGLPLFTHHGPVWGPQAVKAATTSSRLATLNLSEAERVRVVGESARDAGWPVPGDTEAPPGCQGCLDQCPILQAYPAIPRTIGDIHRLLLPFGDALEGHLDPSSQEPILKTHSSARIVKQCLTLPILGGE